MSNNDIPAEDTTAIEEALKELLDKMLDYFQKFIKNDKDLQDLEEKLNDYDNLTTLIKIINEVFTSLTEKVNVVADKDSNENYDELEKIVQKYEGEIRNHIQIEQQLKLYAESLQAKVEESEKTRGDLLDQTKTMINDIKRDNQKLAESCKKLKDENKELIQKLKDSDDLKHEYDAKLSSYPFLQERINALEKITRASENSFYGNSNLEGGNNKNLGDSRSLTIEQDAKASAKVSVTRKVLKPGLNQATRQQSSPLKVSNRNSSMQETSNRNSDFLKVKIDLNENDHAKDLEALKRSYQQFYRRRSSNSRERSSVSKTRELKSMYSQSNMGHNSSNTSIIYLNKNSVNAVKPKESVSTSLHKKSRSSCASPKTKASLTKKEFEKFLLYSNSRGVDSTTELNRSKYK
jgi:hypothetical protein